MDRLHKLAISGIGILEEIEYLLSELDTIENDLDSLITRYTPQNDTERETIQHYMETWGYLLSSIQDRLL